MRISNIQIRKILWCLIIIGLITIVNGCGEEVLPDLPEKPSGPPTLTIKTMVNGLEEP